MVLFPNCKINIGLRILRRRPDGYHDIETVMVPVGWTDILEIVPSSSDSTTLTLTGNRVDCPPEKNLVMKAYVKVRERFPDLPPVDIFLRKIIPDGAGLGGGSSDAAFTIIGLNRLFGLGMSDEQMAVIASEIGADCPFFIYNRPMLATGTGVSLARFDIDLSAYSIVIAKPAAGVSTAQAYSGVTPDESGETLPALLSEPVSRWDATVANDFEKSVFELCHEIQSVKLKMKELGAVYVSMSGSGSAVYGIFDNDKLAETALESFSGLTVKLVRVI